MLYTFGDADFGAASAVGAFFVINGNQMIRKSDGRGQTLPDAFAAAQAAFFAFFA